MNLQLKRPLIFFDIESTGLSPEKDRIIEISLIKVYPDGREEVRTRRLNPECPIPPESTEIHGIKDEDVQDCPTFRQVAKSLATMIQGCDIAGYNSNRFDVPMLGEEFLRAGVEVDFTRCRFIDVQTIYHKLERRTLEAAYRFYCNKELTDAHSAEADTRATLEVLKAQLERYPEELQNDVDFLSSFSMQQRNLDLAGRFIYNDKDEVVVNFGKHKGVPVAEVLRKEPGYYDWVMKADFSEDTKRHLMRLRLQLATEKK